MQDLSYAPDFVLVVIAAWLGATVLARPSRHASSTMFAFLSLAVAAWGASWIVRRLSDLADVRTFAGGITALAGAFLPALLAHLVLRLAEIRPWSRTQRVIVVLAYVVALVFGGASALAPDNRPFGPGVLIIGIPGPAIDWAWVAFRVAVLALAAWWIWTAQTGRGRDRPRPELLAMFGAVLFGALGGGVAIVLDDIGGPSWPGTALLAVAFVFAAYATFRSDLFFAPETARRILWYSLGGALIVAAVAIAITVIDDRAREWLGINNPLPAAILLVIVLGLFDPARAVLRGAFGPASPERHRLMVALGSNGMDPGLSERLGTILDELRRTIGSTSLRLVDEAGSTRTGSGAASTEAVQLIVPIDGGGQLLVGPKASGLPYTPSDWELVRESATYITSSLDLDTVTTEQAQALTGLRARQHDLRAREVALSSSLTQATRRASRLDIFALGPLHVERGGLSMQHWGGPKAGTRQAEAIFAFLFDRGERGVSKEEVTELIWPDVDLERADLAFHRTLGGLRRELAANGSGLAVAAVITFHNDRYHLNPDIVRWSDVSEFEERLDQARDATDPDERRGHLEAAQRLYRGDYLDDCPFYGDSSEVEERRQFLRGRASDVLLALGEIHEGQGDRTGAAGFFRAALAMNDAGFTPAEEGLQRLHASS